MDSKNERQGNPDPGGFRPVREGEEKRMGTRDMGKGRRGGGGRNGDEMGGVDWREREGEGGCRGPFRIWIFKLMMIIILVS